MRTLEQALHDHELIVLRTIGEWWELDLAGADKGECARALTEALLSLDISRELELLPPEDAAALSDLIAQGGRVPVATFGREHGEVRLMGPGRLEREEPWLDPVSAAEALWYRGLLYRGFDETSEGLIEFYYLPHELLSQIPQDSETMAVETPAIAGLEPVRDPKSFKTATTDAIDDLTAILSLAQLNSLQADRSGWAHLLLNPDSDRSSMLLTLAKEAGMLRMAEGDLRPTRAAVDWLRLGRESQLRFLADAWSSSAWNELRRTPELVCEGEGWQNDPILARTALLDAVSRTDDWYRVDDLVAHIKQTTPDFQRPDGNYDTWYVREAGGDSYVTGFENWDLVEGRLIRYLIDAPCYWLGLVETAGEGPDPLFRLTRRALDWLADKRPVQDAVEVPILVQADGSLKVPYNAARYRRFQVARISEAEVVEPGQPFTYRLTPRSLALAQEQGIAPERILAFLAEVSGRSVPAGVRRAVTRWAENDVEARLESAIVLRVRDAAILETLRGNAKTRDYIDESLGDLSAVVRRENWPRLVSAATQLGLLVDVNINS